MISHIKIPKKFVIRFSPADSTFRIWRFYDILANSGCAGGLVAPKPMTGGQQYAVCVCLCVCVCVCVTVRQVAGRNATVWLVRRVETPFQKNQIGKPMTGSRVLLKVLLTSDILWHMRAATTAPLHVSAAQSADTNPTQSRRNLVNMTDKRDSTASRDKFFSPMDIRILSAIVRT